MTRPAKIWDAFAAAPHRVMFFGGALQALAVMLWWLTELVTRYGLVGHPVDWPVMPVAAHAYLMIYGLFPFFMFGFLMTTFPRWMNDNEIPAERYVPAFMLLMLGAVGFYVGLFVGHTVLVVAVVSTLAGWAVALYALLRVLLDAAHPDKQHPQVIFIALCMGWFGLAAYFVWLLSGNTAWLSFAIQGGLWLFLLPVFASVGHRMIPFFTSSALPHRRVARPFWPWRVMLAAGVAHGLLKLADAGSWLWLCDAPLAAAACYLSYVWGMRDSLKIPLLGVLHIGFAWLGIAMLLFTVQSLASFFSHGEAVIWGLAPLHALTIGCFATLMLGMVTRVTLGHSGLPMKVDTPVKLMFVGMQLAALLRVMADMLPIQAYWFYVAAAVVWLACFTPWVSRYLPVYWRVRADGRAG
ncbi:MAG TPA: NnrS family protein [Gallionella sp.]|nr:NnrS family protein [Gallionella sp.]